MIRIFDLRSSRRLPGFLGSSIDVVPADVLRTVEAILRDVQRRGDAALHRSAKKFDGVDPRSFRVPRTVLTKALRSADPGFVRILRAAARNIRVYHRRQLHASWSMRRPDGVELRQRYTPIDRVGVYVPGGRATYSSTVLMNVIPAQVAGVRDIALVSPPGEGGEVHRDVLTAAALLGVRSVFRLGGAQAIGALAFGTESVPSVDKIVGPGNIYVAAAKRLVFGKVGIDSFAGPSEVVILADSTANPDFVASDMLAQAEHDERASSILVTPDAALAANVRGAIVAALSGLPRRDIIGQSLAKHGAILLVNDLRHGVDVVNELAPEHLEIITVNYERWLARVRHAGSIFLGNGTPVAVGDYFAGPNHVLPTGRTARFSSPLSVDDFMKKSSVTHYSVEALRQDGRSIEAFAEREGLTAHARSVGLRTGRRSR